MSARLAVVRSCCECPHFVKFGPAYEARCCHVRGPTDTWPLLPPSALREHGRARIPRWCPLPLAKKEKP